MTDSALRWRPGLWSMTGQVVLASSGAVRGILLVRLLDAPAVGSLFLLLSAAAVAATVGQAGLGTAGLRRVTDATTPPDVSREIRSVLALAVPATVAAAVICALALAWFHRPPGEIAAVVALVTTQSWTGLLSALVRGLRRIALSIAHEQIVVPLLQTIVLIVFLAQRMTPSLTLLVATQAACAAPSMVLLAAAIAATARVAPAASRSSQADRLKESAAVTINGLIWRAYSEVPLWIAGAVTGAAGAALYGVASRLAALLQLPSLALIVILSAETGALLGRRQYAVLEPILRRGAALATLAAAAGLSVIVLGGPAILRVAFGPPFAAAATTAMILSLGQVINAAAGFGGTTLLLMNEARRLVRISLVSTLVLTALAWALARSFGVVGLAVAWTASFTLQNLLMTGAVRRLTGMRIYMTLHR
jgi:O-antigen/teichoic acid export membrane protein